ncbi:UNVERIFIED_CONTAM: hypothetical protein HDU68_004871 [Siphonaria sp. JEL0065]|nr:hypothetical protein HDU68_004871 [Siphonaria sp. JEL0065]
MPNADPLVSIPLPLTSNVAAIVDLLDLPVSESTEQPPGRPSLQNNRVSPIDTSTQIATLRLNYDSPYFSAELPYELEDLLPNYVYAERIAILNESIGAMHSIRDHNPKIRTVVLCLFVILSVVLLLLKASTDELGIWFFLLVAVGGTTAFTFIRSFKYDRIIETHLQAFNDLDANIQLTWSQKNENPRLITFKWNKESTEPKREIRIRFAKKSEVEFLPAYSLRYSFMLDMLALVGVGGEEEVDFRGSITRCPSYRTYAPTVVEQSL